MKLPGLHNKTYSHEQFEEILLFFSECILEKQTESEMLWDVAQNCIGQLGFQDCVIYLVNTQRNVLVQKAASGPKNPRDFQIYQPIEIPVGQGITGSVALTGTPEIVENTSLDPRYITDDAKRLSEVCVPILLEKEIIGVIDCEHPDAGFFNQQHVQILSAIANLCGVGIKNIRGTRRIRDEQMKLIKLQKQYLDLKTKTLGNQLNPHFVFNALNAVQHYVLSGNKGQAMRYLSVFSRLVRFYLKYLGRETVPLEKELEMLDQYLTLQKLRYGDIFSSDIQVSIPPNALRSREIPAFVLQPLLENLIENEMPEKNKTFEIAIRAKQKDKRIQVKILTNHVLDIKQSLRLNAEYRKKMQKWQEHIRLINSLNGYNIRKKIVRSDKYEGVVITLPELKKTTKINSKQQLT